MLRTRGMATGAMRAPGLAKSIVGPRVPLLPGCCI